MKHVSLRFLYIFLCMSIPSLLMAVSPTQYGYFKTLSQDIDKNNVKPENIWQRIQDMRISSNDYADIKFKQMNTKAIDKLNAAGFTINGKPIMTGANLAALKTAPMQPAVLTRGMPAAGKGMPVGGELGRRRLVGGEPSQGELSNIPVIQVEESGQQQSQQAAQVKKMSERVTNNSFGASDRNMRLKKGIEQLENIMNLLEKYESNLGTLNEVALNAVTQQFVENEQAQKELKVLVFDIVGGTSSLDSGNLNILKTDWPTAIKEAQEKIAGLKTKFEAQKEIAPGERVSIERTEVEPIIRPVRTVEDVLKMTDKDIKNEHAQVFLALINAANYSDKSMSESNLTAGRPKNKDFAIDYASQIQGVAYKNLIENWQKWKIPALELSYVLKKYVDLQLKALSAVIGLAAGKKDGLLELVELKELRTVKSLGRNIYTYLNFAQLSLNAIFDQIDEVKTHITVPDLMNFDTTVVNRTIKTFDSYFAEMLHVSEKGWFFPDNGLIDAAKNGQIYRIQEYAKEWSNPRLGKLFAMFDRYAEVSGTKVELKNIFDAFSYLCCTFDKYLSELYEVAEEKLQKDITKTWIKNRCNIIWTDSSKDGVFLESFNGTLFQNSAGEYLAKFGKYLPANVNLIDAYNNGSFGIMQHIKYESGTGPIYRTYKTKDGKEYMLTDKHKKEYNKLLDVAIKQVKPTV